MTTLRITEPGIYPGMAADDYHADCCPTPSFSQSIGKVLLDKSPAHARWQHPRLNPLYEPDNDRKFDVANVAHLLLLGRGRAITVIEADDWRSPKTRDIRDKLAAEGKLGVLRHHFERAADMVAVARQRLVAMGLDMEWGDAEAVIAWREGDMWLRAMLDWLSADRLLIVDFKTTSASAAPLAVETKMATDGWDVQAAMHERGLNVLDPANAGRRRHVFVCQEIDEPYELTVNEIDEAAMTMGRKRLALAVGIWARCMAANAWPGYPVEVLRPSYPAYLETRWLEREIAHDEAERSRAREPMLTDLSGG